MFVGREKIVEKQCSFRESVHFSEVKHIPNVRLSLLLVNSRRILVLLLQFVPFLYTGPTIKNPNNTVSEILVSPLPVK